MTELIYEKQVEKWGVFEVAVKGNVNGNPFTDYFIKGTFKSKNENKTIDGFYDGDGYYKVRFMPSFEETYQFSLSGNFSDKDYNGTFEVSAPGIDNHGPVKVNHTYHFAYEDGRPYYSIGTTCYVWALQSKEMQEKTLAALKNSPFNKIRFCVFPKHYEYNFNEPISYPFEGTPCDSSNLTPDNFMEVTAENNDSNWDFSRFNPTHFQILEQNIKALMELGIEADLIIMHPYDRWGFSAMSKEEDDRYWNYVIARFAAYRNVWWSLANEYDLMIHKTQEDWERYASIICKKDPYNHLRSIHNCIPHYDYTKPWITHCSIQRQDVYKTTELVDEWRTRYQKPVVMDEICYEGNIKHGWGNISGKEMVRRFWEATCRGGYAGHGETYMHPEDILWWSHGGELHGDSPERLHFLGEIMKTIPSPGLKKMDTLWDEVAAEVDGGFVCQEKYYLYYYSFNRPSFREFSLDEQTNYEVDVIDTWEMTIEHKGIFSEKFRIDLPGKEFMAIRIRGCK